MILNPKYVKELERREVAYRSFARWDDARRKYRTRVRRAYIIIALATVIAFSPPWLVVLKIVWDHLLQVDDVAPVQPKVIQPSPDGPRTIIYPGGGASPA